MSKFITTDVKVDLSGITQRIDNVVNDSATMTEVHQTFADIINPWIPYDTGRLADKDVRITAEGVTYYAPWAEKNYYGDDIQHRTDKHPLATAYWDKVAMQTEREKLALEVKEILIRRLGNG